MPAQKRGLSKQDYATDRRFIAACEKRWGKFQRDLAAYSSNTVAPVFFSIRENSLHQDWCARPGNRFFARNWLNPPFSYIVPWARKCDAELRVAKKLKYDQFRIFFLTPASVGSDWFLDHVFKKARVYLIPRLTFEGEEHPYPKDLILSVFGERPGFERWDWR